MSKYNHDLKFASNQKAKKERFERRFNVFMEYLNKYFGSNSVISIERRYIEKEK